MTISCQFKLKNNSAGSTEEVYVPSDTLANTTTYNIVLTLVLLLILTLFGRMASRVKSPGPHTDPMPVSATPWGMHVYTHNHTESLRALALGHDIHSSPYSPVNSRAAN